MAVKAGTAFVDFEGDFSGLNKQVSGHFAKMTKNAEGAGKKIGKSIGVGMAAGVATAVVAGKEFFDFGKEAVNTASDINESLSKNQVLFGKYAKGIEGFSNRSADAFGISKEAALEYTGVFGNLFKALGVSNKRSAQFSTNLTKMAADMASFNNTSIDEALEAIRSGLVGETEPLRKFGVNINDAALKAEALATGIVKAHVDQVKMHASTLALSIAQSNLGKAVKEHGANSVEAQKAQLALENAQARVTKTANGQAVVLTAAQKALAAQKLIIKQTSAAHGDFQRTSDQLANSQRRLSARWEDMKGTLGTALLPAVKEVVTELLHLADDVQPKVEDAVQGISKIFASKDMSLGDKLKASLNLAKLDLQPLADKIGTGLKDAKLDDKLEEVILWAAPKVEDAFLKVGERSAQTWWKGFKEDPLWAVVGTGFIAAKLGLTGPLLKGLTALFKGGGVLSKATPMPVYVVNASALGGLAGGVGGGVGEEGKAGKFSKVGRAVGAGSAALPFIGAAILGFQQLHADQQAKDLDHLNQSTERVKAVLTQEMPDAKAWHDTGEALQLLSGAWSSNDTTDLQGMQRALDAMGLSIKSKPDEIKAAVKAFGDLKDRAKVAQDLFKRGITLPTGTAVDDAKTLVAQMDRMRHSGSDSIRDLRTNVRLNMKLIRTSMAGDSASAREAISANFSAAIENIKQSMKDGTISVKAGTDLIQSYMVRSLMNFGFSKEQALNVAKDPTRRTSFSGGPEEGTRGPGHQRGGYINLGAPSGDSVHAMLERDEYVLNRKAVKRIGKAALDRLNFGTAPRFQKGGSVTGDTDFLPALLHALRAMSASVGQSIFVQSGRRTVAEQLAQGPSTPSHPVAGPNGPHVRGIAADITPGFPVFGRVASRFGLGFTVMPQEPWHIQLLDAAMAAGSQAISAVAQKVAGVKLTGPDSALKSLAQGAIDATQGAAQGVVNKVFGSLATAPGGETAVPGGVATGNGAALMRQISKQRGWNFADWWALDASETSHGANLSNPTSTARLRGQFLDSNYGKYGPGSDPRQNPTMGQQIQSMAAYIAERYGNPTAAWTFHKAHNWYQRGGSVLASLFAPGGSPKDKGAKTKSKTIANILHAKTHKPKDHLTTAMVNSLKKAGADKLSATMDALKGGADKYADWAERANLLTDTDALQTALNVEMTRRGGRSNMTQDQLMALFPAADQDAFINAWLRGNASFNGGIQSDWLSQELNQLLGWRNTLIDNPPLFQKLIDAAVAAYKKLKAEIKRIEDDIAKLTKKRDKAIDVEKDNHDALVQAKKDLDDELKKKKPDKKRVERLRAHVEKYRSQEAAAHQDRVNYNNQLSMLRGNERNAQAGAMTLGGDDGTGDGTGGRIGDLNQAVTDMAASLTDVQGLGSTMAKFISPSQFQLGTLGGTILDVQNSILGLTRNPMRASAEEAGAEPTDAEQRSSDIMAQLLREANLRTAVSEAQFDVFRNLPFGGGFKQGGTVPGPVGAPRMILAHGGEVVIPNDANYTPGVTLQFANGMEWLRQFVSIQVDSQTRSQGRRSERLLPGQGSRR
jgi:hypothetical protein